MFDFQQFCDLTATDQLGKHCPVPINHHCPSPEPLGSFNIHSFFDPVGALRAVGKHVGEKCHFRTARKIWKDLNHTPPLEN